MNTNSIVIYTANFGAKDSTSHISWEGKTIPYLYFTDQKITLPGVTVIPCPSIFDNGCKDAKLYKIMPHLFLSSYKYSIWLDANMELLITEAEIEKIVETYLINRQKSFALYTHPQRDCVYEEYEACLKHKKGFAEVLEQQIKEYKAQEMPEHSGLYACGFMIREHNNSSLQDFNALWWEEIEQTSLRDQISFGFLTWKEQFSVELLENAGDYFESTYYKYHHHLRG